MSNLTISTSTTSLRRWLGHQLLAATLLLAACADDLPSQTGFIPTSLNLRLTKDQTTPGNSPPFIQTLTSQPETVTVETTVTLNAQAFDIENQNLSYRWSASKGTLLQNTGRQVQWKPETNGEPLATTLAIVSVVVDDGQQRSKGDINIVLDNGHGQTVVDETSIGPDCPPPLAKAASSLVLDELLTPLYYEVPPIPRGAITIDGQSFDWSGVLPALQDSAQDHGGTGDDIRALYLAQDSEYLYYRIDTWQPPQSPPHGQHLALGETGRYSLDPYPKAEEVVNQIIEGKLPRQALVQFSPALGFYLSVTLPGRESTGDRTRPVGIINTAEVRLLQQRTSASPLHSSEPSTSNGRQDNAQVAVSPQGKEFRVSPDTDGFQSTPAIATASNGNFLIVWQKNDDDGNSQGIFAQVFNSQGLPIGSLFQVNADIEGLHYYPVVASDNLNNFVVSWIGSRDKGSGYNILAKRYNSQGAPIGTQIQVNTDGNDVDLVPPQINPDKNGGFIIAWGNSESYARRFNQQGTPIGSEIQVGENFQITGIEINNNGNYIFTGLRFDDNGDAESLYARCYDKSDIPQSDLFEVTTFSDGGNGPGVTSDKNGEFIIVWDDFRGEGKRIHSKRYSQKGESIGNEMLVSSEGFYSRLDISAITTEASENYIFTWDEKITDDQVDIFAQRYNMQLLPIGDKFLVNTFKSGNHLDPAIATDQNGNFIITWSAGRGIYAKRYNPL